MRRLLAIVAGAIAALSLTVGAYLMLPSSLEVHDSTADDSALVTGTGSVTVIGASLTVSSCDPANGDPVPRGAVRFEL